MKSYANSPLIAVSDGYLPDSNRLFIKAEYMLPTGSAKARCVEAMLKDYLSKGGSLSGKTIVESTSGNTGLALAHFGHELGYKTLLIVDENCPESKRGLLTSSGAEVLVLKCGENEDPRERRIEYAEELSASKDYVWLNQYNNAAAAKGHISTAYEIAEEIKADYCFVAVGTGCTLRGIMDGMKECSPTTVCIGVEPYGSLGLSLSEKAEAFLSFGPGYHKASPYLNGIRVPGVQVRDKDTILETKQLINAGIPVGLSTGMCIRAMKDFIRENRIAGKNFVVIGADSSAAYEKELMDHEEL